MTTKLSSEEKKRRNGYMKAWVAKHKKAGKEPTQSQYLAEYDRYGSYLMQRRKKTTKPKAKSGKRGRRRLVAKQITVRARGKKTHKKTVWVGVGPPRMAVPKKKRRKSTRRKSHKARRRSR